MYCVECSYQKAIIDDCKALDIPIEEYIEKYTGAGEEDSVQLGMSIMSQRGNNSSIYNDNEKSMLGESMVLLSSNGN